jgi:hypothetical protein
VTAPACVAELPLLPLLPLLLLPVLELLPMLSPQGWVGILLT